MAPTVIAILTQSPTYHYPYPSLSTTRFIGPHHLSTEQVRSYHREVEWQIWEIKPDSWPYLTKARRWHKIMQPFGNSNRMPVYSSHWMIPLWIVRLHATLSTFPGMRKVLSKAGRQNTLWFRFSRYGREGWRPLHPLHRREGLRWLLAWIHFRWVRKSSGSNSFWVVIFNLSHKFKWVWTRWVLQG